MNQSNRITELQPVQVSVGISGAVHSISKECFILIKILKGSILSAFWRNFAYPIYGSWPEQRRIEFSLQISLQIYENSSKKGTLNLKIVVKHPKRNEPSSSRGESYSPTVIHPVHAVLDESENQFERSEEHTSELQSH